MRSKRQITTVGINVGGEPSQVIIGGVLPPRGKTMFERMVNMQKDSDHIRRFLMLEPRGHVILCVNLTTPPTRDDCAAGMIVMESTKYVPMSGSNTISTVTALLETGIITMEEPETRFRLDTPAGPVDVLAHCKDGACIGVEFKNVPSMVLGLDIPLEVPGFGIVTVDVAYGGMIYAIADATQLGFALEPSEAREIAIMGEKIRIAAREQFPCRHPENPDIKDVTIVQIAEPFKGAGSTSRTGVIVSPGRLDRSPTGTAMSARMAVLHARGQMKVGDTYTNQSVIHSSFTGKIVEELTIAGRPAIRPAVTGRGWVMGMNHYFLDPTDPFPEGYVMSVTWGVTGITEQ